MPLIISNLEQIVTVCENGELYKCGAQQDVATKIERRGAIGCTLVANDEGLIVFIGFDDQFEESSLKGNVTKIDGSGSSLIPGFVDAHSHPVWSGDRTFEFELKMRGATYLEVHEKGGGIYYTVDCTKKSSKEELSELLRERLRMMLSAGSTLVECKTGYGLEYETELKMLELIDEARSSQPVELVTTFLGAHAIPKLVKLIALNQD